MIKRVELQHKIKYLGEEYSVKLYNNSDFTTLFKTLQYPSGIMSKTEREFIRSDINVYDIIFKKNGQKIVHFYSDEYENNCDDKIIDFIDNTLNKYNASEVFILFVLNPNVTMYELQGHLNKFDKYANNSIINVILDSNIKKKSIRIIIGS